MNALKTKARQLRRALRSSTNFDALFEQTLDLLERPEMRALERFGRDPQLEEVIAEAVASRGLFTGFWCFSMQVVAVPALDLVHGPIWPAGHHGGFVYFRASRQGLLGFSVGETRHYTRFSTALALSLPTATQAATLN